MQWHMPFQEVKYRSRKPTTEISKKKVKPGKFSYLMVGRETIPYTNLLLGKSDCKWLNSIYLVPNNIGYILYTEIGKSGDKFQCREISRMRSPIESNSTLFHIRNTQVSLTYALCISSDFRYRLICWSRNHTWKFRTISCICCLLLCERTTI